MPCRPSRSHSAISYNTANKSTESFHSTSTVSSPQRHCYMISWLHHYIFPFSIFNFCVMLCECTGNGRVSAIAVAHEDGHRETLEYASSDVWVPNVRVACILEKYAVNKEDRSCSRCPTMAPFSSTQRWRCALRAHSMSDVQYLPIKFISKCIFKFNWIELNLQISPSISTLNAAYS